MMRFLELQGFRLVRIRGVITFSSEARNGRLCLSMAAATLKIGTLRGILREIELSPARFAVLWGRQ